MKQSVHPLHQFVYCPICGQPTFVEHNGKSKMCTHCGFVYYFNPSAAVACFIKNEAGELLLVRRAKEPGKGSLDLPGGFVVDIDTEALANSTSCSLQAMQFALFTNPKKIYIVGIDCTVSSLSHFIGGAYDTSARNESAAKNDAGQIAAWRRLKLFAQTYYPETEIISVNPVGLKGIFRDVYTKEYLHKHPEIDAENVEILEDIKNLEKRG